MELLRDFAPRAPGKAAAVAEAVTKALATDPDVEVRLAALAVFERLRRPGRVIGAHALRAAVESDPGPSVRELAAGCLVRLARVEPAAVCTLGEMLVDGTPVARRVAAKALAELGQLAKPALPDLIQALSSDDTGVWPYAARALGALGPAARPALPALEKLARERPDSSGYYDVRQALKKIRRKSD